MTDENNKKNQRAAIDRLAYEIKMLSRTLSSLSREPSCERSWLCTNLLVHGFLLAVRNLLEFFFPRRNDDRNIYARTCVESWECKEPEFKEGVHWSKHEPDKKAPDEKPFFDIHSQRLHHLTWARVEESKLDWHEPAIAKELMEPIQNFRAALRPDLRSDYFEACVSELQETCKRCDR